MKHLLILLFAFALASCSDAPAKQPVGAFCGDGSLDPGEFCDPAIPPGGVGECPTACPTDACTFSMLVGSADDCTADCVVEFGECGFADGCCPGGACTFEEDSDCMVGPTLVSIGNACANNSDCGDAEECFTEGDTGFPGGYCVSDCTTDDDCPSGAGCTDDGKCFRACEQVGDCERPGYVCGANVEMTQAFCVPGGTGETPLGGECNETSDCAGGAGVTCLESFPNGGYCSRFCGSSADCPNGAACDSGGYCLETCTSTEDCRTGYRCDADNGAMICLPSATGTGEVGDACVGSPDCAGGEFGFCAGGASFPDNYCSVRCGEGQAMCPVGSFCVAIADGSICFDSCDTNADCREGYECSFDFGDPSVGGCLGLASP